MDPPHDLGVPDNNKFLSGRNSRKLLYSRSLSTHGLHIPPHIEFNMDNGSRHQAHHRLFEMILRFPRLLPPPENCSSLGVMYTAPRLQAMIYI